MTDGPGFEHGTSSARQSNGNVETLDSFLKAKNHKVVFFRPDFESSEINGYSAVAEVFFHLVNGVIFEMGD